MPDQNVTVNLNVNDFLTQKLRDAKQAFQDAGDAASRAGKSFHDAMGDGAGGGGGGAGGGAGAGWKAVSEEVEKTKKSTSEEGFLMEQLKELAAGIGYNIGLWNVGMMASQAIIDGITNAIKQASDAEQSFVHFQNIARLSTQQTLEATKGLEEAVKAANIGLDQGQKMADTLYKVGVPLDQINADVEVLGKGLKDTGEDFTDIYAKARMNEAGVQDIVRAADALGPDFRQAALDFQKLIEQSKEFELHLAEARRTLARQHEDQQWAHEDLEYSIAAQQRLNAAQLGFAGRLQAAQGPQGLGQPAGMAGSAGDVMMNYFARAGTLQGVEYGMNLNLPSGVGQEFGAKVSDVIKGKLASGLEQFQKEWGISGREAQVLAGAGLLTSRDVMAAAERGQQEQNISREHDFQLQNRQEALKARQLEDQEVEHTTKLEETRVDLNKQIVQHLMMQLTLTHQTSQEAETFGAMMDRITHSTQEASRAAGEFLQQYKTIQREVPEAVQEQMGIVPGGAELPPEQRPGAARGLGFPQPVLPQQHRTAPGPPVFGGQPMSLNDTNQILNEINLNLSKVLYG